eukprot:9499442-Pyramimonas_sp.AAC.1
MDQGGGAILGPTPGHRPTCSATTRSAAFRVRRKQYINEGPSRSRMQPSAWQRDCVNWQRSNGATPTPPPCRRSSARSASYTHISST